MATVDEAADWQGGSPSSSPPSHQRNSSLTFQQPKELRGTPLITLPDEDLRERRAQFASLIERFGKAWEKLSSKLMAEVFAEDAVFIPDPWEAPVTTRAAIEQYWGDIPYEQSEISFRFGEIYVAGPWFSTEFKCTFRRRRTGEEIDVRGALFCETEGEAISEMRMYWDRRVGR